MLLSSLLLSASLPALSYPSPIQERPHHGASLARWESFLKAACDASAGAADTPPFSGRFGYGI
ncbi:MAG: hypothetical protein AAGG01_16025, partial [Planctomycetota bacterium]